MAVYDGVPSIRLEGDQDRALALIPEAKALLYQVQEFARTAEVTTFSSSRRVGDRGYIYVLCSRGVNIIHISVDVVDVAVRQEPPPQLPEISEAPVLPSFYSGITLLAHLEQRVSQNRSYMVCSTFAPTPSCVDLHEELVGGFQSVTRLAVRPYFDDLDNQSRFSQYTLLRPSMYSGTMATAVQLVMGLGRVSKNAFRDPDNPTSLSEYAKRVGRFGVQVRYDFKFHRTHGITIGPDGTRWLIEISQARGVLAMRLPVFPGSYAASYAAAAEARGDGPMVAALEELGCLPTGEVFPLDVTDAVAAGDVLQLLPAEALEPFYQHMPYSWYMGWAFNPRGSEAHNTAYRFGDDDIQRGVWYQISISIGALTPNREPGQPVAVGTAALRLQSEGILFATRTPIGRFLPIKFYDPLFKGLHSHDAAPASNTQADPRCDTVMYVHFVGDDLKTVRFFRNPATENTDGVDDPRYPDECIFAGEWVITTTSGERRFATMMYTNDFDDRRALNPYVSVQTITSTDLGFNPPRYSDIIMAIDWAYVYRTKAFKRVTHVDTRSGETAGAVVVVPQYCRELHYYAFSTSYTGGRSGTTSVDYDYLMDPNVGWSWRNFPAAASGDPSGLARCRFDNCGGRRGRGNPHTDRRIVCIDHVPRECSDFADSGTWLSPCQSVDSFNSVSTPVRRPTSTSWNLGADVRATLKIVGRGYSGPIELPMTLTSFDNVWSRPSPDPETGEVQQLRATYSALGDDCIVYDTDIQGGEVLHNGYTPGDFDQEIPCFVGVNRP